MVAFKFKYNFEEKARKSLFKRLKKRYEDSEIADSYCGKAKENIFKTVRNSFKRHEELFKYVQSDANF